MDFLSKISNKGKIKYGALLAGFLALVITIIIVFNSIISILGDRYNWFFDMTDEQFYSASDAFVDAMGSINQNAKLEIIFLDEEDTVSNDHSSVGRLVGLSYVHQTATDLARKLDNVTVTYHSLDDTKFVNSFGGRGTLESDYVIIKRTDISGGSSDDIYAQFEIYTPESFYVFDDQNTLFAYNGETTLLEAAIRLSTSDIPTVYFTSGHGETGYSLMLAFKNAGFNLAAIDLDENIYTCVCGKEYSPTYDVKSNSNLSGVFFPEDERTPTETQDVIYAENFKCSCGHSELYIYESMLKVRDSIPKDARSIIINEAISDFTEPEIHLLNKYLSKNGSVMAFLSNEIDDNLPNLYGWFNAWGGISVGADKGYVTINQGETKFDSAYSSTEAADSFLSSIKAKNLQPAFNNALPLYINQNYDPESDSYIPTGYNCERKTTSLLTTQKTAFYNGTMSAYSVMAITHSSTYYQNPNHETQDESLFNSYLVVASGGFSDGLLTETNINTNSKVLRALFPTVTQVNIYATDIDFKVFNNYALDISGAQQITFLIISIVVLPLIAGAVGFVVIFRRKRR